MSREMIKHDMMPFVLFIVADIDGDFYDTTNNYYFEASKFNIDAQKQVLILKSNVFTCKDSMTLTFNSYVCHIEMIAQENGKIKEKFAEFNATLMASLPEVIPGYDYELKNKIIKDRRNRLHLYCLFLLNTINYSILSLLELPVEEILVMYPKLYQLADLLEQLAIVLCFCSTQELEQSDYDKHLTVFVK